MQRLKWAEASAEIAMREKEALEGSINRAYESVAEAQRELVKEKERMNAVLSAMSRQHAQEKEQLEATIAMLEAKAELAELERPWYQQDPPRRRRNR